MENYLEQAINFLKETNTTITIKKSGSVLGFPNAKTKEGHFRYRVTIKNTRHSFSFYFYGSHFDYLNNKHGVTEYDILATLQKYDPETLDNFIDMYGYEIKSVQDFYNVRNIYKATVKEYKAVRKLFTDEEINNLMEIF